MSALKNAFTITVLAGFLFSPLSLCGQTYVTPPVQQVPGEYVPSLQAMPQGVGTVIPHQGQILPANATFTSEQAIQPAQTIPLYPNDQPGTITQPRSIPSQVPTVQVPWTQSLVKDVETSPRFWISANKLQANACFRVRQHFGFAAELNQRQSFLWLHQANCADVAR